MAVASNSSSLATFSHVSVLGRSQRGAWSVLRTIFAAAAADKLYAVLTAQVLKVGFQFQVLHQDCFGGPCTWKRHAGWRGEESILRENFVFVFFGTQTQDPACGC